MSPHRKCKKKKRSLHSSSPVILATREVEDCSLRPVPAIKNWACCQLQGKCKTEDQSHGHKNQDLIEKIKLESAGGMAPIVEHLPGKHETLNSVPSTAKKRKEKENAKKKTNSSCLPVNGKFTTWRMADTALLPVSPWQGLGSLRQLHSHGCGQNKGDTLDRPPPHSNQRQVSSWQPQISAQLN
jgi:hypothetical protein